MCFNFKQSHSLLCTVQSVWVKPLKVLEQLCSTNIASVWFWLLCSRAKCHDAISHVAFGFMCLCVCVCVLLLLLLWILLLLILTWSIIACLYSFAGTESYGGEQWVLTTRVWTKKWHDVFEWKHCNLCYKCQWQWIEWSSCLCKCLFFQYNVIE